MTDASTSSSERCEECASASATLTTEEFRTRCLPRLDRVGEEARRRGGESTMTGALVAACWRLERLVDGPRDERIAKEFTVFRQQKLRDIFADADGGGSTP